ncbi:MULTISPECIES: helix-turn-helix domain-containing protein [unclassified Rummeliibacillus]|uniref:helix-turn-helix domain-containing protein n=1 Tax=unclassified Rummeliibacillus TaxID=2622809 RepID=UPI000E66ECB4|nr:MULTISPECIES: helix-turn-helix transcriptional regulator [unclassified Rummeliibacillus]RIJ64339.1 XRE family transcriptional regulator [Rummeliibacillus sp. POC4]RPJ94237.1 XRE family transcriptional regulator [Rummeliibacillus sp. TYF005]
MENSHWGIRIRAFRKLKRINQDEFAKLTGIPLSILGKIERGERQATEDELKIIAKNLKININELKGEI